MKTEQDMRDALPGMIQKHLGCDAEAITPEARFVDDLGADSLDVVELVMSFEEEFDIEISDDIAETLTTVGEAADALARLIKAKA